MRAFDFLRDGSEERIRAVELQGQDALETVRRLITEASPEKAEKALADLTLRVIIFIDTFYDKGNGIVTDIPTPRGFFVGDDERKPAYRAACRFLLLLEELTRNLQRELICLTDVEDNLLRVRATVERAMGAFGVASADRIGDTKDSETLSRELTDIRREIQTAFANMTDTRAHIAAFLTDVAPSFCTQINTVSDLKHRGASCDPRATVRLCGELLSASERLVSVLRQSEYIAKGET